MQRTCTELMQACKSNTTDREYWIQLHNEIHEFLNGDNPEGQKNALCKGMYVERVDMMYLALKN